MEIWFQLQNIITKPETKTTNDYKKKKKKKIPTKNIKYVKLKSSTLNIKRRCMAIIYKLYVLRSVEIYEGKKN